MFHETSGPSTAIFAEKLSHNKQFSINCPGVSRVEPGVSRHRTPVNVLIPQRFYPLVPGGPPVPGILRGEAAGASRGGTAGNVSRNQHARACINSRRIPRERLPPNVA